MRAISFSEPRQTFLHQPFRPAGAVRARDFAVFGASFGTPYPAETEMGYAVETGSAAMPEAVRAAANQSSTNIDHFDFDLGGPLLGASLRGITDCGDLMLTEAEGAVNRAVIQSATALLLKREAVPVLIGGDDSVPIPFLAGFAGQGPIDILQIDAHIDWRDSVGGERLGYSSTMRRASEQDFVRSITQVGMRGVGSAGEAEVAAAKSWGAALHTVRDARRIGAEALVSALPKDGKLIIQIDCDALDPSVCPAVNAPTPGGFQFDELANLLQLAAMKRNLAGLSIVELAPEHDVNGNSAIAAARLICNIIGAACRAG
jgi:agmatinase